jgi:hypothetical protein
MRAAKEAQFEHLVQTNIDAIQASAASPSNPRGWAGRIITGGAILSI